MSEEKVDWVAKSFEVLEKLPPELQYPVIIGALMVAVVWIFWRKSKNTEAEKEPSHSRTVHIGGSADKAIIQTGDNDQANSKDD